MKRIIFFALALLLYGKVCFASETVPVKYFITDNGMVSIQDNYPVKSGNITVVLIEGNSLLDSETLDSENMNDKAVYFENVLTDSNGKYDISFILKKQGVFSLFSADKKTLIVYADKTKNSNAINELFDNCNSAEDVLRLLDEKGEDFAIIGTNYEKEDTRAANIVFEYIQNNKSRDGVNLAREIDKAYLISGLKNGKVSNIGAYLYSSGITDSKAEKYWSDEYSAFITSKVKNCLSIEAFDAALSDALIISVVKNSGDVALIKSILEDYSEEKNIDDTYINDYSCRNVNLKSFNSVAELIAALKKYTISKPDNGDTGAGGGSGGGGGYVSSSTSKAESMVDGITVQIIEDESKDVVFDDLEGYEWAKESIEKLYSKGIIAGKTEQLFYPGDGVLREEMVKMIIEASKLNVVGEDKNFDDVKEDSWYYSYVQRGYKANIIKGISENLFGSGMQIKRQDLAVMVNNLLYECGFEIEKGDYRLEYIDCDCIDDYALKAIENLSLIKILSGDEKGRFNPHAFATRAEAAKIICKMIEYMGI